MDVLNYFEVYVMFAIVAEGGNQYFVKKGTVFSVEKLEGEVGSVVSLPKVLVVDGKLVGKDLKSATVKVEILEQKKDKKVVIFKKKRRQGYKRKNGHRQQITVVKVSDIAAS